jgi:hypothetical protein
MCPRLKKSIACRWATHRGHFLPQRAPDFDDAVSLDWRHAHFNFGYQSRHVAGLGIDAQKVLRLDFARSAITEHWLSHFQARGQSSRFSWSFVHAMPLAARSAARNCMAR